LQAASLLSTDKAPAVPLVIILNATELAAKGASFRVAGVQTILLQPFSRAQLQELLSPLLTGRTSGKFQGLTVREQSEQVASDISRLLVIDDAAVNRMLVQTFVTGLAIEVAFAEDGRSGLDLFHQGNFDFVLLDLSMPDMDGYAVVKAIRDWERGEGRPPTPIIAFTAHVTMEHEKRALAEGFSGYLRKPVRKQEFLQILAQYGVVASPALSTPPVVGLSPEAQELLPSYVRSLQGDIRMLHQLIGQGLFDRVERIGHNMKGTAVSFGLGALSRLGSQLEKAAIDRDASALTSLVVELESGVEQAASRLRVA
jgi:CheY-like chemotaxis protein